MPKRLRDKYGNWEGKKIFKREELGEDIKILFKAPVKRVAKKRK